RPDAQNIVDAMKPDGMIRSVHFLTIEHPEHGAGWQWPFDNPEFKDLYETVGTERTWELYMATLLDAIDKLPGQIVGHFYVPAKFGHWPSDAQLAAYEDQLVEACAARGFAIEISSRYFYRTFADDPAQLRKYRDATLRLLKKAKAKGVLVAVGSDAHSPKDQGAGFDDVLKLLDAAGINEIAFPIGGRLARVALRASEELLKAQAVPPPPPVGSSVTGFGRAELAAASRNGGVGEGYEPESELPAARGRRTASAVKSAVKSAAAERRAAAQPPKTAAVRAPAKTSEKTPAKSAPKTAAKPVVKPVVKAVAKAVAKLVAKVKPPAKAAAKKKAAPAKSPARQAAVKKSVAKKAAPKKKAIAKKTSTAKRGAVKKTAAAGRARSSAKPAKRPATAKRTAHAKKQTPKKGPAKKPKSRPRR
ncbi:MAG TPA: hypothetical protein VKG44_01290, partial [Candidatus Baltobacteraceae bacterium]|nr:hypothetical protein [Candidatus Baltobacteraceae bacterium]